MSVDVEGYVPQVIENVGVRSHVVDTLEGFHLVRLEVYLEPAQ